MRKRRELQSSIYDIFPDHEQGQLFQSISKELDKHPRILNWIAEDFDLRSK